MLEVHYPDLSVRWERRGRKEERKIEGERKKGSNELILSSWRQKFKCYFTVMPSTITCLPALASIAEVCSGSHVESRRVYSQNWVRLKLQLKGTHILIIEVHAITQDPKTELKLL